MKQKNGHTLYENEKRCDKCGEIVPNGMIACVVCVMDAAGSAYSAVAYKVHQKLTIDEMPNTARTVIDLTRQHIPEVVNKKRVKREKEQELPFTGPPLNFT